MSQWPKWLRRQYGKLEICGSSPGYDTNFPLKNYHLSDINIFNINVKSSSISILQPLSWSMDGVMGLVHLNEKIKKHGKSKEQKQD